MSDFSPYTVYPISLANLENTKIPESPAYLVFWHERIPLGQRWVDQPIDSKEDFYSLVSEAVRPAISYYMDHAEKPVSENEWMPLLLNESFSALAALLSTVLPNPVRQPDLTISVIICTRNRTAALKQCVDHLMDSVDKDFELIIVDNAPDDTGTEELISRYKGIRYIREPRKGLDIARNTGAKAASRKILAYTDDDVIVDRHWISNLKQCFSSPLTMAVTGMILPWRLDKKSQYQFEKYWSFNKGFLPRTFDPVYFRKNLTRGVEAWDIGAGANMAFRREVFDLIGGFDERLDVGAAGCSGDSEFWYRILAEGWNCVYCPALFVYHQHRESEQALQNQLYHYMKGHVCALLIQHERYKHQGNLKRLFSDLPLYYFRRLKNQPRHARSLFREISGCIAGYWYYQKRKRPAEPPPFSMDRVTELMQSPHEKMVSVIIPCHNHASYLKASVESVLNQTHKQFEIIVVDDGSEDDTAAVCAQYPLLRYIRTEQVGPCTARNIGVSVCKGDYLVFLDADDLLYPRALEINLRYFDQNPELAFVSGAHRRIDDQGNTLPGAAAVDKPGENYWSLLHGNYIAMEATVMYRRILFPAFHFDPKVRACEDYDLNLAISRYFPVLGHTEIIAAYRIHAGNRSRDRKMMIKTVMQVLHKQKPLLKNKAEWKAYQTGIRNWKKYYSGTTDF